MNTTSEAIFQTVDILVDKKLAALQYDKTVTAEIYSIVNLDTGEYKVKYSGNIVSAFSDDVEKQYKVGDNVYVTIPQDDLSARKRIVCKTSEQSLSYGEMMTLSNSIVEKSPTFDTMYGYDRFAERGVVAGAPADSDLSYQIIYEGEESGYHGLFRQYASENDLIRIKASFLTTFHCEHTQGNYGLEVQFFTQSRDIVSYRLDLSAFNGDPYRFQVYSPQSIVIQAQKNYLTGLKQIKLFEENFVYDRYVESGRITDKENRTVANIFVKDIEIQFVERRDLTDNLYYLDISTPQGNAFTDQITTFDLVGRLIYQGDNIMSDSTCECKWFERDISVMLGSELYDKNAGVGWAPVAASESNTMTLTADQVAHQKQYKLVVIYNENVVMTAQTTIYNLNSDYLFSLHQTTVGEDIIVEIQNNADDTVLIGDWYMLYPDGSYTAVEFQQNEIVVTNLLLYSSVTFICGVYNAQHTEIIGVLEHTITNSSSEDDVTISYSGEDTFRYDANGDIAVEDAEKERTLQVVLAWRDGVGTSYRVEWIGPDGKDITNIRYNPSQSMIENLWVDNSNILHYTIKQKYKVNFNNNTILVRIITMDGQEYAFQKEILFLKDGDQGTNGTTYVTAVRPFDTATGLKLSGLNPLIYRNNAWQNTLPLRCYVYKDGELINDNGNYTLSYQWTGINVNLADGTTDDRKVASGMSSLISTPVGGYVKVQVTINDNKNGRTYDIYCNYPIDVALNFTDDEVKSIDISSIPSYIKYTASGVNPQFYSNNIQFLVNGIDRSNNITSLTQDILTIEQDDGLYYLEPAASFIFEDNSVALLRCADGNKYIYHPVILYLDTYGNEAINGWDGTSLVTDKEEGQYIYAPQIGAGTKDSFNRFTGVVMGKDTLNDKIGLYGYQAGINTFGLMENGIAYFGAKSGGGQIVIDGTTAEIYGGGNYPAGSGQQQIGGDAPNGMTITLADLRAAGTTNAIKIGGGVFAVKYNGALTATSATIDGVIYARSGKIGCSSRSSSDGWTIETNRIYSGNSSTRVELNSATATNTTTPTNNNDFAMWAGSNTASSAKFSVSKGGLITAKEGNIGGWILSSNKLTSDNYRTGMASSGTYRFWAGASSSSTANNPVFTGSSYFYVTSTGEMNCRNAIVNGTITADKGTIGGWTITTSGLQNSSGTIRLSTSSLQVGDNFSVSSSGRLTANNANITGQITADSGRIGGWRISDDRISAGGTTLYDDGRIRCDELTAYNADISGNIEADYLECYSGYIGGWTIDRTSLSAGSTTLTDDGDIYAENFRTPSGYYLGEYGGYIGIVGSEARISVNENTITLSCSGEVRIGDGDEVVMSAPVTFNRRTSGISADDIDGLTAFIQDVVEPMIPSGGGA